MSAAVAAACEWGSLRVVVGCAGIGWAARTINREGVPHDLKIFQKVMHVNLVGLFNVLRLAASAMSKNDAIDGEKGVVNPKRLGEPAEYAQLVQTVVENAYLNGDTIRLDGALRMAPK